MFVNGPDHLAGSFEDVPTRCREGMKGSFMSPDDMNDPFMSVPVGP